MIFRSKQQPIEFSPGYWSEYVQVSYEIDTTEENTIEEVTTEEDITEEDTTAIFVVVGVVILLGGVALVMLGFGYFWYKKR